MRLLTILAVTALLLFGVSELEAQQREITGRVTNSLTGQPVTSASVMLVGSQTGVLTDNSGIYSITVPTGPVQLTVGVIGYKQVTVDVAADQAVANVELEQDVVCAPFPLLLLCIDA